MLIYLAANPGRVVTKGELLSAIWADSFVEEANLSQQVYSLRKALGDRARCIVTVPGRGYQLTAEVRTQSFEEIATERQIRPQASHAKREGQVFVIHPSPQASVPLVKLTPEASLESPSPILLEDAIPSLPSPEIQIEPTPGETSDQGHARRTLWLALGVTAVACLGFITWLLTALHHGPSFEHFIIEKVTDNQRIHTVAISPDGSFFASVIMNDEGGQTLWIEDLRTRSEHPLEADTTLHYQDLIFSPNSDYLYFLAEQREPPSTPPHTYDLYRIPVFGGQPVHILAHIDAPISFIGSTKLCYYRQDEATYQFLRANLDGGEEQVLTSANKPYPISNACAPDGSKAAIVDNLGNLEVLGFASREKHRLGSLVQLGGWLSHLKWDAKGTGLYATQKTIASPWLGQIVFLSYPSSHLHAITRDFNDYSHITLTADGKTIAAVQAERNLEFEAFSLAKPSYLQQYGPQGLRWFTWLDDEKVLASDETSSLRIVDLIKGNVVRITGEDHAFYQPAPCGSGSLVASGFNKEGDRTSIYTMRIDGGGITRVSSGPLDLFPECTADGKWLYYTDNRDAEKPYIMRMPVTGGATEKVAPGMWFDLSADNRFLSTTGADESRRLTVLSMSTLQQVQSQAFPMSADGWIAFSADSRSIYYSTMHAGGSTLWNQPIGSKDPAELANIHGRTVVWIKPSPSGQKVGLISQAPERRGIVLRDVP